LLAFYFAVDMTFLSYVLSLQSWLKGPYSVLLHCLLSDTSDSSGLSWCQRYSFRTGGVENQRVSQLTQESEKCKTTMLFGILSWLRVILSVCVRVADHYGWQASFCGQDKLFFQTYHKNIHTHPFNGPLSGTIQVSRYQKGKTNLDFTEARDSEWLWHQLGHMQIYT